MSCEMAAFAKLGVYSCSDSEGPRPDLRVFRGGRAFAISDSYKLSTGHSYLSCILGRDRDVQILAISAGSTAKVRNPGCWEVGLVNFEFLFQTFWPRRSGV